MDIIQQYLPNTEKGVLPYYLLLVATAAVGNSFQNLFTLHYTRRLYKGLFVPNPAVPRSAAPATDKRKNPEDRIDKLVQASATGKDVEKARDQVTPLAARLFGLWTIVVGVIRIYAAYDVTNPALYQLALFSHAIATLHWVSELVFFKTVLLEWETLAPMAGGFSGLIYMTLQYSHYLGSN